MLAVILISDLLTYETHHEVLATHLGLVHKITDIDCWEATAITVKFLQLSNIKF